MMDDKPIVGKTKQGELTLDQIASMQPGLNRLMPEIGERYWILYYAAQGGNWALAHYQLRSVRLLFKIGAQTRPNMASYLEAFDAGHLGALERAIEAKDWAAFDKAYQDSIVGLNNLHAATHHGYIVWKLPGEPPKHLDLGPQETQTQHHVS
jgi:hypothetical protein